MRRSVYATTSHVSSSSHRLPRNIHFEHLHRVSFPLLPLISFCCHPPPWGKTQGKKKEYGGVVMGRLGSGVRKKKESCRNEFSQFDPRRLDRTQGGKQKQIWRCGMEKRESSHGGKRAGLLCSPPLHYHPYPTMRVRGHQRRRRNISSTIPDKVLYCVVQSSFLFYFLFEEMSILTHATSIHTKLPQRTARNRGFGAWRALFPLLTLGEIDDRHRDGAGSVYRRATHTYATHTTHIKA